MLRLGSQTWHWASLRGFAALGLLIGTTACSKPLNRSNCEELLIHYVDLLAASDRPETSSLERLHFRQEAKRRAAQDPEFAQCNKSVSRRQFECAVAAQNTDDFERCLM